MLFRECLGAFCFLFSWPSLKSPLMAPFFSGTEFDYKKGDACFLKGAAVWEIVKEVSVVMGAREPTSTTTNTMRMNQD